MYVKTSMLVAVAVYRHEVQDGATHDPGAAGLPGPESAPQ